MDSIVKWEYKRITSNDFVQNNGTRIIPYVELLNDLGQQGWEAVGPIISEHNGSIGTDLLFKRPCGEIAITRQNVQEQERNSVSYDGYER